MRSIKVLLSVCISLMIQSLILSSCKTDDFANGVFEIAPEDLTLDLDKEETTVYIPINSTLTINDWEVDNNESWITFGKKRNSLVLSFEANAGEKRRTADIKVSSPLGDYIVKVKQYSKTDVVIKEVKDVKVSSTGATANQEAERFGIANTTDGNTGGAPYLSSNGSASNFPVTMEYTFPGEEVIDYATYYPTAGKGAFGKVKVYTATKENPTYTLQQDVDLNKSTNTWKCLLPGGLKLTKIKFEVSSAEGDAVGCQEMEFYTKIETMEEKLLKVFTDITCSELNPGVDDAAIAQLPAEYFMRIAENLKNNTYNEYEKEFRIQEYKIYSNNTTWANKLLTKKYTDLDNPTGICVEKDDELIVLVGDIPAGKLVYLQCIGERANGPVEAPLEPSPNGPLYFLKKGVNKLKMTSEGQLYVMYNADDIRNTAPVKIHIPLGSGKVTGYFDIDMHKTDAKYAELINKACHKYFCVRGERIMFYFHTDELRKVTNGRILPSIEFWNNLVKWEQELMGIEDVQPSQMNNHMLAVSPEGGYMWATDTRIGFAKNTLFRILVPEVLTAEEDNVWGPAHEIGHIHQKAIDWPSCSESSNNIFSNYLHYRVGKYCSRGAEISRIADAFSHKEPWALLGQSAGIASAENEDTELHMRMNWQLWIYFHLLGNDPQFFPKLFKELRANPLFPLGSSSNTWKPGEAQIKYAQAVAKVANMDMSEFFERWGFFREVDINEYEQYGKYPYKVDATAIMVAKMGMQAMYIKKVPPIYYLEDRKNGEGKGTDKYKLGDVGHYTQFKENAQITTPPTYTLSGHKVTVTGGQKAIAFEVRKGSETGELLYFFNFFTYDIPSHITLDETTKFYAIQADGKKVEMKKQ